MTERPYGWVLAILSAVLLIAPIRTGDLAGYDDALYAHLAKDIVVTGDWLNPRSNGYPALEHPPLFPWMQAALFSLFGYSDPLAKLPSALCGLGTILLVYWLARRLLNDAFAAVLAMFVMASTLYFLKYAARGMTDVPFTFLFLAALCAWTLAEDDQRWYLAAGLLTGMAQLTRGLMALALPAIFVLHLIVSRRRPPLRYALPGFALALLLPAAWYGHLIYEHGGQFFAVQSAFLGRAVNGALSPPWRRYTGAPEYAWMLAKSYWPWLPFMLAGLVMAIRSRDNKLSLLVAWTGVVFAACAVIHGRVLRYMLPAYPAFSILAAAGLRGLLPERHLRKGFGLLIPVLAIGVMAIAIFPPARWHAAGIRPIAAAADSVTADGERVGFYDAGQPRFDETNQLQWYGNRRLDILLRREDFAAALREHRTQVFIVDRGTYNEYFDAAGKGTVVAENGHLVCVRLAGSGPRRQHAPESAD